MRRALGWLMILHGLAHANAGMWAAGGEANLTLVTVLWTMATAGFIAAGCGLLGLRGMRRWWRGAALGAAAASIALLVFFAERAMFLAGGVVDVLLLAPLLMWLPPEPTLPARRHPLFRRLGYAIGWAFIGYVTVHIGTRPWQQMWGSLPSERRAAVPGDTLGRDARYRIDHGITIGAPADSVWPWIAQIGQDRGGFYSYDWLERLVGDDVRNADRIHPDWQLRKVGDLLPATQPGYLGIFRDPVGWRVTAFEPGRYLVLENWGAFIVEPVDSATSRFLIRTRGSSGSHAWDVVLAPFGLLIFEPAHFIMQREMLRGVKARAEGVSPG